MPDDDAPKAPEEGSTDRQDTKIEDPKYMKIVGMVSLSSTALLTLFIIIVCIIVLQALTTEPQTLQEVRSKLLNGVSQQPAGDSAAGTVANSKAAPDESLGLTFRAIVMLEYATADIRMAGVQLAVALVAGLLFVTVGLVLFSAGIASPTDISGGPRSLQFKLVTSSPGIVAIALGGAIIISAVLKDVRKNISADVQQAVGLTIAESRTNPEPEKTGVEPTDDPIKPH